MRNNVLLSALLIICLSVGVAAEDKMTKAAGDPRIYVNTYSKFAVFTAINKHYSRFAQLARNMGLEPHHGVLHPMTDETLAYIDILVLAAPYPLLDEEKAALKRFLRRGGGLLFMSYNGQDVDLSNYDTLLRDYGIELGTSTYDTVVATVVPGSILSGPYPCYQFINENGCSYLVVNPKKAETAAFLPNGKLLGAVPTNRRLLGLGRMVVFGSFGLLLNDVIVEYDNTNLAKNILTYLLGGPDLHAKLCKFRGSNVSPGSRVKLIAKVRNDGNEASPATIVRFFLCTTNTYDGSPPEVIATLGSADLPALNPGKSKKVKIKVNIPATVTPGDYYVIAVADPDGTSGDINTSNNYKASKKKITIG